MGMRLGIVGMLPGDFRTFGRSHFEAIRALGFTGAGFHLPGDLASDITKEDIERCRMLFIDYEIELVQMGIGYAECLFHPDTEVRDRAVDKIVRTVPIGAELNAHYVLIRPGSMNPEGSWTPHRENLTTDAWSRFLDTLGRITPGLAEHDVTIVMETHLVSILKNPEACRQMVEMVGSTHLRLVLDYVNHFETLKQVFENRARLDHIFEEMGPCAPVMHVKDITLGKGLVLHIEEAAAGTGELDLEYCFQAWQNLYPEGYGLIEHLPPDLIPQAAENTRAIASAAGIPIH